jgi:hypothetical protein
LVDSEPRRAMGCRGLARINKWSYEEDIRGLREALNHVAGLPLNRGPVVNSMVPRGWSSNTAST